MLVAIGLWKPSVTVMTSVQVDLFYCDKPRPIATIRTHLSSHNDVGAHSKSKKPGYSLTCENEYFYEIWVSRAYRHHRNQAKTLRNSEHSKSPPRPSKLRASTPAHQSTASTSATTETAKTSRRRRPRPTPLNFKQGLLPRPGDSRAHPLPRPVHRTFNQATLTGTEPTELPAPLEAQRQASRRDHLRRPHP